MIYRLCSCGAKYQGTRGACAACLRKWERNRDRPKTPYTSEYKRAARAYLDRWVAEHGEYCPGAPDLRHKPHPAPRATLTLDHIQPLSEGGTLMDPTNHRVLCRSANSKTGRRRRDA